MIQPDPNTAASSAREEIFRDADAPAASAPEIGAPSVTLNVVNRPLAKAPSFVLPGFFSTLLCLMAIGYGGLCLGFTAYPMTFVLMLCLAYRVGHCFADRSGKRDWRFGLFAMAIALVAALLMHLLAFVMAVVVQSGASPFYGSQLGQFIALYFRHFDWLLAVLYFSVGVISFLRGRMPKKFPAGGVTRGQRIRRLIGVLFVAVLLFVFNVFALMGVTTSDTDIAAAHEHAYAVPNGRTVTLHAADGGVEGTLEMKGARLAFSPDGAFLATAFDMRSNGNKVSECVLVRNLRTKQTIALNESARFLTFSSSGELLLTADPMTPLRIWDMRTSAETAEFKPQAMISSLAVSPDDSYAVLGLQNGEVVLFNLRTFKADIAFSAHRGGVVSMAFADSTTLLTASALDTEVKVWDFGTQQELRRFPTTFDWITHLSFSPTDQLLAIAGGYIDREGEVILLDAETGAERRRYTVHANTVQKAIFTRDGSMLIGVTAPAVNPFTTRRRSEVYRWKVP